MAELWHLHGHGLPQFFHRPSRRPDAWTMLALLYLVVCTLGILYAPQPLLNVLGAEFGTSKTTTALAVTCGMFPLAVAPLLYGPLVSMIPARRLLLFATLLLAATGVGLYLTRSFALLLVFRVVQGMLVPVMMTAIMAHISRQCQGAELQRALAVYIGCTVLGGFLGRAGSGALSSLVDWRFSLLVMAILPLLALPALFKMSVERGAGGRWHPFREYLAGLRDPGVGSVVLVEALMFFVFGGISNFLPFRMAELGQGEVEFVLGLMYTGYLLGAVVAFNSRRLTSWFGGPVHLMLAGLACYLPMLLLMAVPSSIALFVGMSVICLGQFTAHSNAPGLVNRLSTLDKGMINGLYLTCYYSGGSLGSWLPGYVFHDYGWNACLLLFAALIVVAMGLVWRLNRQQLI
ncbi:MAG TPA: MFS transporter [Candidatus Avidesulfovibrio excrementigallinarum]|nr:MFS transporter [Candidatus Avidesulfovibrio excrementigallinarum]